MPLHSVFLLLITVCFFTPTTSQRTCFPGSFRVGKICNPCPPGTFSSGYNKLSCEMCPMGTFRSKPGARSENQCIPCAAGTTSNIKATSCKACPPGQHSLSGSRSCARCSFGSALSRETNSGCDTCDKNYFAPRRGTRVCIKCPEGTITSRYGARKCEKCPPGTFRSNVASFFNPDRCIRCLPGSFSDQAGARWCKRCPPGTFSRGEASECTPCPLNTFNNRLPAIKCRPCPSGTSTSTVGAAACRKPGTDCPFNTFEDKEGACKACAPGERLHVRRKVCLPCRENEVSDGGDAAICKKCPEGRVPMGDLTFQEKYKCECKPGSVEKVGIGCVACEAGTFWERSPFAYERSQYFHEDDCTPCPIGTFTDKPGSTACKKCPVNTFTDLDGRKSCQPCPKGMKSPRIPTSHYQTDRGTCVNEDTGCSLGEVLTTKGECKLQSCPSTTQFLGRDFGNMTACTICFTNQQVIVGSSGIGTCENCDDNEINPEGSATTCMKCPPGQIASQHTAKCVCRNKEKNIFNGRCVSKCPLGWGGRSLVNNEDTGLVINEFETCVPCSEVNSRFVALKSRSDCVMCPSNMVAINSTKCVRCPKGQIVPRNFFGELLNSCQPK